MRTTTFCTITEFERADSMLRTILPYHSRAFFQDLIAKGQVLVQGKPCDSDTTVQERTEVRVSIPDLKEIGLVGADIPLSIIYEDDDLLVIDKPAGMVVHPTDNGGHLDDTLVNALIHHSGKSLSVKSELRPGIVHRLDKDTSGLIVVAKNDTSLEYLAKQWEERSVEKEYIALVAGEIKEEKGAIEAPIGRSASDRKKMAVRTGSVGKEARTEFEVLQRFTERSPLTPLHKGGAMDATLLKVKILTGRTHQIRVHFASIGHPVIGDRTYGNPKMNQTYEDRYGLARQFLHAHRLVFRMPGTGKQREFISPLPADLQACLPG